MPFWKSKSKLAGRVFAILRLRPTTDTGESSHLEPTVEGRDHSDLPSPARPIPTPVIGLTSTRADPIIAQSDISPSISDSSYSSNDPVQAHNYQSASLFSRARDFTVNGGRFYTVGGNLTVQGIEPREFADMFEEVRETVTQTIDRRLEETIGRLQLPPVISTGFLYVMDATGRRHTLTMDMAHSFEQFTAALRVLFYPERPQNIILQKYMDIGAFVLTIDDGREHLQLTDQEDWSSTIRGGVTIIMSIIMSQEVIEATPTKYQCPFCDCWNKLRGNNGKSSIDCRSCKRRFQVKPAEQDIDGTETASIGI